MAKRPGFERRAVAAAGAAVLAVLVAQAAVLFVWRATGHRQPPPGEPVSVLAVPLALILAFATRSRATLAALLPAVLDGAARRRPLAAGVIGLLLFTSLVQTARVSAFMADPALTRDASDRGAVHLCMAAYVRAGELARAGAENIYLQSQYSAGDEEGAQKPESSVAHLVDYLGDAYEYPPPLVAVARGALLVTNDFLVLRAAWFTLQAIVLLGAAIALAVWIGGREGLSAGLLAGALGASVPFWKDLEFGQIHLFCLALAVIAMALFEERRDWLGGALLAAAIVVKIAPGLLLVYLLARRRVRPVATTAVFIAAYALAALVVLGPAPYVAFFGYQLPRMANGTAFAFAWRTSNVWGNFGVASLPPRLRILGVKGLPWGSSTYLAWLYGVLLLPLTVVAARRTSGSRLDLAQRSLALLNLAALRSPYAAFGYVTSGVVWLLTLLVPGARSSRALAALGAAWVYLGVVLFLGFHGATFRAVMSVGQLAVLGVNLWAALRGGGGAASRLEGAPTSTPTATPTSTSTSTPSST